MGGKEGGDLGASSPDLHLNERLVQTKKEAHLSSSAPKQKTPSIARHEPYLSSLFLSRWEMNDRRLACAVVLFARIRKGSILKKRGSEKGIF